MKTIKFVLLSIILSCVGSYSYAQDFTQQDKEAIQQRVKAKVEEFQGYLSSIVNKDLSDQRRLVSIESALALFMGNGEPYYTYTEYGERERHREVRMQISSVNRTSKSSTPMKRYLNNQYRNIMRYAKVVIESADAVRVDNIYKVGEGQYECVAYFGQKYISYNQDGHVVYGDFSRKKVRVHITAKEIPTVGIIFEAKLGDIYVVSTERL